MTRQKLFLLTMALLMGISATIGCGLFQEVFTQTTATPTPTITPTITPTLEPDLSEVALTLDDLPPGFVPIPLDELGVSIEDLGGDDFEFESFFLFLNAANFEYVMGLTTLLQTTLEQAGFDAALSHPELMISAFATGMGATDISEIEELENLDDIGDISAGYTITFSMIGIPMRMDMVIFRRDVAGAFVLVMYIEGDTPVVSVGEAARKLDAQIIEELHLTP